MKNLNQYPNIHESRKTESSHLSQQGARFVTNARARLNDTSSLYPDARTFWLVGWLCWPAPLGQ